MAQCWSCTRWSFTSVWEAQEIRYEICNMHRCMMVCFFCVCVCLCFVACVWLHTFPSLLPSLHACMHTLHARIHYIMHTYITCTHTYAYTCIQIHAPDIQHIHRHTVHIYTYLHISIYSTFIYMRMYVLYIYMYIWIIKISIYIHTDPCAPVNGPRKLFDHTSGQFSLHERLDL